MLTVKSLIGNNVHYRLWYLIALQNSKDIDAQIDEWMDNQDLLLQRWKQMLSEFKTSQSHDFAKFSVALRELMLLSHNCDTQISEKSLNTYPSSLGYFFALNLQWSVYKRLPCLFLPKEQTMFYDLARRFMFTRDAEWAHEFALNNLRRFAHTPLRAWSQSVPNKPVNFLGLEFKNPVGLAAGLDKNAECIDAFSQMGFGFVEVGTVTPRPQAGNDKPRIFRLPESNAIINRMGFNNKGVDNLVNNVKAAKYDGILGINIGKNKDTPNSRVKMTTFIVCAKYLSMITSQ